MLIKNIILHLTQRQIKNKETPFTFEIKDQKGKYEVRTALWGYIYDLQEHILKSLDSLKK